MEAERVAEGMEEDAVEVTTGEEMGVAAMAAAMVAATGVATVGAKVGVMVAVTGVAKVEVATVVVVMVVVAMVVAVRVAATAGALRCAQGGDRRVVLLASRLVSSTSMSMCTRHPMPMQKPHPLLVSAAAAALLRLCGGSLVTWTPLPPAEGWPIPARMSH